MPSGAGISATKRPKAPGSRAQISTARARPAEARLAHEAGLRRLGAGQGVEAVIGGGAALPHQGGAEAPQVRVEGQAREMGPDHDEVITPPAERPSGRPAIAVSV